MATKREKQLAEALFEVLGHLKGFWDYESQNADEETQEQIDEAIADAEAALR